MVKYSPRISASFIATLGTEPQVVSAALDLLINQGVLLSEIIVIHTTSSNPLISNAINRLKEDFSNSEYSRKLALQMVPLVDDLGHPLSDVETPQAAQSAFKALYQLIRSVKKRGNVIHLSIAGGRKTLALYAMVAAQLLFDENDRLWYLFSSGDYLASKRLHPSPNDDVSLVPIPVILWSKVSPMAAQLREVDDPFEAIQRIEDLRLQEKLENAREFINGSLTQAEKRVVEILVRDGLSDVEIAERLFLSPRTVEQHLRSAYLKAAAHWGLKNVNRAQLVALLQYFFITRLGENTQDNLTK